MSADAKKIVIVDTDPGVDDAMALLFLHASPTVNIHSITTVFGNADVMTTTKNAAYLVDRFNLGVPVFSGANAPLARERFTPELKVHGEDGFGDTGVASAHHARDINSGAAQHIVETIKKNPGAVTLLAMAPLTNLAEALRLAPEIEDLVGGIVVMGGAFGGKGRNGNIRPHAEANIFYDPEAANLVLSARWPVTIIGLDVTLDCILSSGAASDMGRFGGEAGTFLRMISRGYEEVYRDFDGIDGCCIHDVAVAVYLVHPELFKFEESAVAVSLSGELAGQTICAKADDDRRRQKICRSVNAEKVVSVFIETIKSYTEHPCEDKCVSTGI